MKNKPLVIKTKAKKIFKFLNVKVTKSKKKKIFYKIEFL